MANTNDFGAGEYQNDPNPTEQYGNIQSGNEISEDYWVDIPLDPLFNIDDFGLPPGDNFIVEDSTNDVQQPLDFGLQAENNFFEQYPANDTQQPIDSMEQDRNAQHLANNEPQSSINNIDPQLMMSDPTIDTSNIYDELGSDERGLEFLQEEQDTTAMEPRRYSGFHTADWGDLGDFDRTIPSIEDQNQLHTHQSPRPYSTNNLSRPVYHDITQTGPQFAYGNRTNATPQPAPVAPYYGQPHTIYTPVPTFPTNSRSYSLQTNAATASSNTQRPTIVSSSTATSHTRRSSGLPFSGNKQQTVPCVECRKSFQPTRNAERCPRCYTRWERANRGPPYFQLNQEVATFEDAHARIFPYIRSLHVEDDDIPRPDEEDQMIQRFLHAINEVYPDVDPAPEMSSTRQESNAPTAPMQRSISRIEDQPRPWNPFYARQQSFFNKKGFSEVQALTGLRMMYKCLLVLHCGGQSVFPVGGDNAGYSTRDTDSTFSERCAIIEAVFRRNKRVVSDVIEGRGVAAFVQDPFAFERRKTDNETSNLKKKNLHAMGKLAAAQGVGAAEAGGEASGSNTSAALPVGRGKRKATDAGLDG